MRKMILLLLLSVSFFCVKGQNNISLKIVDIKMISDSLVITVSFENVSEKPIRLFKPTKNDICLGLISIFFYNIKNKDDYLELLPCDMTVDLDEIIVNCFSTVILRMKEKIVLKYFFKTKDFTGKFSAKKTYKVVFDYKMKDVNFSGTTNLLFRENTNSDTYTLPQSRQFVIGD